MAVNHANIFDQLEILTTELNKDEFIYGFMTAFDFKKSTLTAIRQGGSRNMANEPGHVGLKNSSTSSLWLRAKILKRYLMHG